MCLFNFCCWKVPWVRFLHKSLRVLGCYAKVLCVNLFLSLRSYSYFHFRTLISGSLGSVVLAQFGWPVVFYVTGKFWKKLASEILHV